MPYQSAPFPRLRMPRRWPRDLQMSRTPTSELAVESNSLWQPAPPQAAAECHLDLCLFDLSREWLLIRSEVRSRDDVSNSRHPKFLRKRHRIGKAHHFAHHQKRGTCKLRRVTQLGDRRTVRALLNGCSARDNRARGGASESSRPQLRGDVKVFLTRHIDHQCRSASRQLAPVRSLASGSLMRRDKHECR